MGSNPTPRDCSLAERVRWRVVGTLAKGDVDADADGDADSDGDLRVDLLGGVVRVRVIFVGVAMSAPELSGAAAAAVADERVTLVVLDVAAPAGTVVTEVEVDSGVDRVALLSVVLLLV